jgi:hypothetical protein
MSQVVTSSPTNRYPFQSEMAFLGANLRRPQLRYDYDGRKIICWLSTWHYAGVLLVAALVGPVLTAILIFGTLKENPWYVWAVVIVVNVVAWLAFVDALVHRYRIEFDLTAGEISFFFSPHGKPRYVLDMNDVNDIFIERILRLKNRSSFLAGGIDEQIAKRIATVECFSLGIRTSTGGLIHLLETTERNVLEDIKGKLEQSLVR